MLFHQENKDHCQVCCSRDTGLVEWTGYVFYVLRLKSKTFSVRIKTYFPGFSPRKPLMARVRGKLRCGFSTGTAASAAARAALRHLVAGEASKCVAIRLPTGIFLPVPIHESHLTDQGAWASVIKDGGDDPDVTHKAEIQVTVKCVSTRALKTPRALSAGFA